MGLAIYAIFLIAVPFAHHDLICELKTPGHCTACTSSVVGADPSQPAMLGTWTLTDVGRALSIQVASSGALLPVKTTGRSPPAS